MEDWVGWIAGACTTVSWVPQLMHIIKHKSAQAVSWGMFSVFVTGIVLWIVYGVFRKDPILIFFNIITLALTLSVMFAKWYYDYHCVNKKRECSDESSDNA